MVELKRIDPEAAGKIISLIVVGFVVILGVVYVLLVLFTFFLTILAGASIDNGGFLLMLLGGIGTTLFFAIVGAVLGFVKGWIGAALYNWISHMMGGLRFEISGSLGLIEAQHGSNKRSSASSVKRTTAEIRPPKRPSGKIRRTTV
ncbi:MAG: hypothetical protein HYZ08_03235 [Candidatus Kerfeldbacteria bacterium]|nr:hypothetical protein [Candidatus Kerfeldbacteria bacterium]